MRMATIFISALALAACQKIPDAAAPETKADTANPVSPYTVNRICDNGTRIYGPPPYAIYEGGQFFNIEGTPQEFCEKKK